MLRPPKYTDDEIVEAIDSLIAQGRDVALSRANERPGDARSIVLVSGREVNEPGGARLLLAICIYDGATYDA